jgi:hypothetical protein
MFKNTLAYCVKHFVTLGVKTNVWVNNTFYINLRRKLLKGYKLMLMIKICIVLSESQCKEIRFKEV